MGKSLYILFIFIIIALLVFSYILYNQKNEEEDFSLNPTTEELGSLGTLKGIEELKEEKSIKISFYDSKANCSLNGNVYLNNNSMGQAENGIFLLKFNESELTENNNILEIKGLTDSCFNKNQNLPFLREWNIPFIDSNNELALETELNPRRPTYYYEIQGFVRPAETEDYISDINKSFTTDIETNLDKLNKYGIRYRSDLLLFNEEEYWQTPRETLDKGHGDCEDWALTSLSMIREYNPSLECYNLLWESHLSVFCYINGNYIIYDQDKTKFKTKLVKTESNEKNKIRLREMRNNYFEYYGLKPNERNIYAAFNEKELVVFENQEKFIEWLLNIE